MCDIEPFLFGPCHSWTVTVGHDVSHLKRITSPAMTVVSVDEIRGGGYLSSIRRCTAARVCSTQAAKRRIQNGSIECIGMVGRNMV